MTLDDISTNNIILTGPIMAATKDQEQQDYIYYCLERFFSGDYGEIPADDIVANNKELETGAGRLIAKYPPASGMKEDFYIMAHFNEDQPGNESNYTSIFYCSEY